MRRILLALPFALFAIGASAQGAPTVTALLAQGFELKGLQYLSNSIVVILQRHSDAYLCDLTLNGETKICVQLK